MKTRIIVALILSCVLLAILHFGGFVYLTSIAVIAFAATYETAHITTSHHFRPHTLPAYLFALGFPFVYSFGGITMLLVYYLTCIVLAMIGLVLRRPDEPENAIISLLFFVYPLALLICTLLVYTEFGLVATIFLFAVPILTDTFAYFGGYLFGKHKLCPSISPKKTVEGAVAGLLGGIVTAVALIPVQKYLGGTVPIVALFVIGLICSCCAQFGDLFASLLKRWAGVKDFGSIFPGHGGVMDRIDSILICSPVVLCLFTILQLLGI